MAVSHEVARARFARVVRRALADARERGLTDITIQRLTGAPYLAKRTKSTSQAYAHRKVTSLERGY